MRVYSEAEQAEFREWFEGLPSWKDREAVKHAMMRKSPDGRHLYGLCDILTPDEVARHRAEFDEWLG